MQRHKLFTIYTCPLLLLSAPSCYNKTISSVSASTLLVCPMLNKLCFCLVNVETSMLSGKIFYVCVNDASLNNCLKGIVWCLSWGIFQLLTQIATATEANWDLSFFCYKFSAKMQLIYLYATIVVNPRSLRNCEEKTIEKHKTSGGGTGVSQFGPPLGLYH